MSDLLTFFVPGHPVPKGRPRLGKGGHVYTPDDTRQWENMVKLAYRQAYPGRDPLPKGTPVELWVSVRLDGSRPPECARGDWDNFGKAVSDALNTEAYHDDVQVVSAHVLKELAGDEGPGVRVWLRVWRPFDPATLPGSED